MRRSPAHGQLRDRLVAVALATLGIDLVCAVLAFLFERHAAQTQITTFGSALFWTSTQLLTVSSQLQNPLTVPGRILDVLMEAYALTVVATLAGSVGAFMVRRAERDAEHALRGGSPAAAAIPIGSAAAERQREPQPADAEHGDRRPTPPAPPRRARNQTARSGCR